MGLQTANLRLQFCPEGDLSHDHDVVAVLQNPHATFFYHSVCIGEDYIDIHGSILAYLGIIVDNDYFIYLSPIIVVKAPAYLTHRKL